MNRPSMPVLARALVCLLLSGAAGCKTEVSIKNSVPRATLENVRWITEGGEVFSPTDEHLLPGQASKPITISEPNESALGHLEFELILEGRKVALATDQRYKAKQGDSMTFDVTPQTTARNPLASQPTSGEPVPAGP